MYSGVYVPLPPLATISPNGDGIAERQTFTYKVVRQSDVTATLVDPTGADAYSFTGARAPGVYKVTWPSSRHSSHRAAQAALGRWRWVVNATDDLARDSSMERTLLGQRHPRLRARRAEVGAGSRRRARELPADASREGGRLDPDP